MMNLKVVIRSLGIPRSQILITYQETGPEFSGDHLYRYDSVKMKILPQILAQ